MKWGWEVVRQIEPVGLQRHRVWSAELDTLIEERFLRRIRRAAAPEAVEQPSRDVDTIDPWSLLVDGSLDFADDSRQVDVAGTEHIKTCPMCHGEAKVRCPECGGEGMVGYRRGCWTCRGSGQATCDACEGQGRLVELHTVELLRRYDKRRHVDSSSPVPAAALERATRDELLHLDIPRVDAATYDATMSACRGRGPAPDEGFELAVRAMIVGVRVEGPSKVVRQRMIVRHVPVDEVQYEWRGDPGRFWLVGTDEQVYGDDMPLQRAFVSRAVSAARERFGGLFGMRRR